MKNVIDRIIAKVESLEEKREILVSVVGEIMRANCDNKLVLSICTLKEVNDSTSCGNYSALVCSAIGNRVDLELQLGTGSTYIHNDYNHEWNYPKRSDVEYFLGLSDEIMRMAESLGDE